MRNCLAGSGVSQSLPSHGSVLQGGDKHRVRVVTEKGICVEMDGPRLQSIGTSTPSPEPQMNRKGPHGVMAGRYEHGERPARRDACHGRWFLYFLILILFEPRPVFYNRENKQDLQTGRDWAL